MKKLWIVGGVLSLTLVSAVACGDDNNSGGGGGTGGATGGTGGATGGTGGVTGGTGGATGGTGGGLPTVMCDPNAPNPGACENATDCPFVPNQAARNAASDCGQQVCINEPAASQGACVIQCMQTQLGTISTACATCYAQAAGCTLENCKSPCITYGTDSSQCTGCQVQAGCLSDLETCSGLDIPGVGGAAGATGQ